MKKCNGYLSSIETLGTLDGPGVRVVVFLSGCALRCKFCHNPETWLKGDNVITLDDLYKKIMRYKPYFQHGGITFSGGEPLLQDEFLLAICKKLKKENINIAIDTAGYINKTFNEELFKYIDLIILDVKATCKEKFKEITGGDLSTQLEFIRVLNKHDVDVWIRQVIIPGENNNIEYIKDFNKFIRNIKNIRKVELLPYHNMAEKKYKELNLYYEYRGKKNAEISEINELSKYIEF